jgi:hypothetical protein
MDIHINKKIGGAVILAVVLLIGVGIGLAAGRERGWHHRGERMGNWSKDTYNGGEQYDDMDGAPNQGETASSTSSATAGLGEHCGGNMTTAAACSAGLHCAPTAGSHLPFGDVGGTCVANQ